MTKTAPLVGKVALITGAARGQGRAHAIRLAREGADIIAFDVCADYPTTAYPMASAADLEQTAADVRALGRTALTTVVDVRDHDAMASAITDAVGNLGRLDIVVANAGICVFHRWSDVTPEVWRDIIDTNLTGAWNTMSLAASHLIAAGGGSIIATGSTCGVRGVPFFAPYVASKHGLVGVVKTLANELAQHNVRANVIHPAGVITELTSGLAGIDELIAEAPRLGGTFTNALPIERLDSNDISNAVFFLASDESRYITGTELKVDAGNTNF